MSVTGCVNALLPLLMLVDPIRHFEEAVCDAWQKRVASDFCCRTGFRTPFVGH